MSRATLVIDGHIEMDDDLHEWHQRPPEVLVELVKNGKPGAQRKPYLVAAAMAIVEATAKNQPVRVVVQTSPSGWTLTVDHWQSA